MQRNYKLLIISLLLLNLYNWVGSVEAIYGIPKIIKYLFAIFVFGTIVYYRILNPSKPAPGKFYYFIIVIFVLWSLILVIAAGLKFDNIFYLQRILGQPLFYIPYILPIFLLYTKFDLEFFGYYCHYAYIFIIPGILIQFYIVASGISQDDWEEQTARIMIFDLGAVFLLLTSHISRNKHIFNIALFYTLMMIFLYSQYGRRGVLLEYMIFLFALIIIRLRSYFLTFNDRIKIYFAGLLLPVVILSLGHLATSSYAFQRGFSKDSLEDSRSVVLEDFFYDFKSTSDWVYGRGLDGKVFRSINPEEETAGYIENGFLTVILKGGLLYLVPFLIIILRASYLGFFHSNNDLVKVFACILLVYVIIMFYFNLPVFGTKYIFLWIAASACMTPGMRNYSNEEVFKTLNASPISPETDI